MNKTKWNETIDVALRGLDAAESSGADAEGGERARALFARIVAQREHTPGRPVGRAVGRAVRRRPAARRAVAVGAVAAAVAAASVAGPIVAPKFFGGSSGRGTLLAWSAMPQPLNVALAREAEEACDASIRDSQEHFASLDLPASERPVVTQLRPVITELRGSLVLVYATDSKPAPSTMTCYVRDGDVVATGGSAATTASTPLPPIAADSLHGDLGAVYSTSGGSIRGVTGNVGSDVVAVVLDSVVKGPVTATVKDGHFAAWWPDAPTTEEKENAAKGPEITGAMVSLRDGTTRQVSVEELSGRTAEELGRPDSGGSASTG